MTYKSPGVTADLIVEREGKVLLIRRKNDPFKGMYAIPGGFLDYGIETLEEAACRELREETNLIAKIENLELVDIFSDPDRDPRGHVISHAYYVKEWNGVANAGDDADKCKWVSLYNLPRLAFDHNKILEKVLEWKIKNSKD